MKDIKNKLNSKCTKDKIIEFFFTKHLKPVEISKELKVGMPYITKIIQKDSRYIGEKETRRLENKEKNKVQKRIYAKSIGGISGRLLTYEEANILKENYSDIIFVTYGNSKYYWLGSARDSEVVYGVYGRYSSLDVIRDFSRTGTYGVRPVIEISKSVIQ